MNSIEIPSYLAHRCAEALVNEYNLRQGKTEGSVRLIAFRTLYDNLCALGQQREIAAAIKPNDYPQNKWFSVRGEEVRA